ncbi:NPP1 protein [Phytophthora nicotianae]|uniref:NPP1 protein n=1 Tax=Phytophthora nicotianae TaxID=4792 RepID=A0A0W8DRR6_PHYNI|nr:NPP1 protein [Phytophthora nicotianae]
MVSPATSHKPPSLSNYGQARFVLDASDVQAARDLGLLRDNVVLDSEQFTAENYGLVYDRLENLANHEFASQKAARSSFKELAVRCGFQIFVKQSSVKSNNSGNAKYRCKKLHGAQFFDQNTPVESLECPFFVNVFGFNRKWKVTKMNLARNHVKHVEFAQGPFVEGSVTAQKTSCTTPPRILSNLQLWL